MCVAGIRTATGTGSNLWRTQAAKARLIIPFHKESCTSISLCFFSAFYPINSIWCAHTSHSPPPLLLPWLVSSTNRFLIEFISRSSRPSWYYRHVAETTHTHTPDNASQGRSRVERRAGGETGHLVESFLLLAQIALSDLLPLFLFLLLLLLSLISAHVF